jgi:hypothetical protein|eukprot:COSAG01_NODE_3780_length_5700_cov_36.154080_4_plen_290_part_00
MERRLTFHAATCSGERPRASRRFGLAPSESSRAASTALPVSAMCISEDRGSPSIGRSTEAMYSSRCASGISATILASSSDPGAGGSTFSADSDAHRVPSPQSSFFSSHLASALPVSHSAELGAKKALPNAAVAAAAAAAAVPAGGRQHSRRRRRPLPPLRASCRCRYPLTVQHARSTVRGAGAAHRGWQACRGHRGVVDFFAPPRATTIAMRTLPLSLRSSMRDIGPIMKLLRAPPSCVGAGMWMWGRCLLLQDIGVTGQAFQYDPKARLAPASQPAATVTRPLHSINL